MKTQATVVISGASGGLGEALATTFARTHHVLAGVRKAQDFERLNAIPNIEAIYLDLARQEHLDQLATRLKQVPKLAALINNAGITNLSPLEEQPLDEIEQLLNTNVLAPIKLTQLCLPRLREVQGQIINIGSTSGVIGAPLGSLYAASKFALRGFSEALAREVAPQEVTVTHVISGAIKTNIWSQMGHRVRSKLETMSPRSYWYYRGFLPLYEKAEQQVTRYALDPQQAAQVIADNFYQRRPKRQLLLGTSAKIQYALGRLIPTRLLEWMLAKRFHSPLHPGKDWSGLKYFAAETLGEEVDTFIMTSHRPSHIDEIYVRHHAYGDGMALLTDFFYLFGTSLRRQPLAKKQHRPSLFKMIQLFIRYGKESRGPSYRWRFYQKGRGIDHASDHLLLRFDKEATADLLKAAKSSQVGVTSFLLARVNKLAKDLLIDRPLEHPSNWLLPVNFRGIDGTDFDMRNRTTSLCLNLEDNADAGALDRQMKQQISDGMPWAAWLHSNVVRVIGLKALTYLYQKARPSQYLGVYSNLGVWPNPQVEITNADNLPFIYLGPPSTSMCPIAIATVTWQGQLSMSVRVHHDFYPDDQGATILAQNIKDDFMSCSATGSATVIKLSAQQVREEQQRL